MHSPGLRALALGSFLVLAACEPTNLYVAHDTVVGVNAAVNTERTKGRLVIGYDRNFVTLVPKSVPDINGGHEAMAALSCSELKVDGIFLSKFIEYLTTGQAALAFAEKIGESGDAGEIFECFSGGADK